MEQSQPARLFDLIWDDASPFAERYEELQRRGIQPTAFFCAHDGLAVTVVSELLSRGLRIPKDASVIGFGDFSATHQILPPLTTVRVPGHDLGAAAVRILDARLASVDFPRFPMRILIPNTLIERQSVAAPPKRHLAIAAISHRKKRRPQL
jgi:LacI family transcriptional regulator